MDVKYRLIIDPAFERLLSNAMRYIRETYGNPVAAERLAVRVHSAIRERLSNPLGYPIHRASPPNDPYRHIIVQKYIVFYKVVANVMYVRFIFHGSRDLEKLLDYD